MVADASIVDGRLEPGRRRGWNVYTGCVCAQNAGRNPGFSVGWGLVGESGDVDSVVGSPVIHREYVP